MCILIGCKNAGVEDGILWVNMMLEKLLIFNLIDFGVCVIFFECVVVDVLKLIVIKGNLIFLIMECLIYILY